MAKIGKVEKKRKERFEVLATHLPGVALRVKPGAKIDIFRLRKTIETLYDLAKKFAPIDFKIKDLEEQKKPPREYIIEIAESHEGLRGIISEEENFVVKTIPKREVEYNRDLLKKALGSTYPSLVREELEINVIIPIGFGTEKGIEIYEEAIINAIKHASPQFAIFPKKVIERAVNIQRWLSVDEKKLTEMVNQGQVKLPEGAKKVEVTWSVIAEHLN